MTDEGPKLHALIAIDPSQWLEHAQGSRMSADVLYKAFWKIMDTPSSQGDARVRKLAYVRSYMLLMGVAFESLIKGLAVAQGIDWSKWRERGGHGISIHVKRVTTVAAKEIELLERFEEHSVWAGRYVVPMKPEQYTPGHRRLNLTSRDHDTAAKLFDRIEHEYSYPARAQREKVRDSSR